MEMRYDLLQTQQGRVSPRLIQANRILGLSSLELQQDIQQEIADNPALEATEQATCPACGRLLTNDICQRCPSDARGTPSTVAGEGSDLVRDDVPWPSAGVGRDDSDFDPLTLVAAGVSLSERLLVDLEMLVSDPRHSPIADFLVGSLDENGWLSVSIGEVSATLDVDRADVEHVLALLHTLEPVGVGARTLRDCLLIQATYLVEQGSSHPHVITIITRHLDDVAGHRFGRIAHVLGISVEEVTEACRFIRQQLNPHPARQQDPSPSAAARVTPRYLCPDIVVAIDEQGDLEVEVVESKRVVLTIDPQYHRLWHAAQHNTQPLSSAERDHVHRYLSRAKVFMANLEQRRRTMQRISAFVVEYQEEFVRHGVRRLRPLTRAMVAANTGLHESTVSRATAEKNVMLPNRRVVPFAEFFQVALSVKDVIREMVASETRPLTDDQIALNLREQGHRIARRTVAKYRTQLQILPSSLRTGPV